MKSIEELKTWEDLAEYAPMVLFNKATSIEDGAILQEWQESHFDHCEAEQARYEIEQLENSKDKKDIKRREKLIAEWGECPECSCEAFQWFIIDIDEWTKNELKKLYNIEIFYSDVIDNYILPVYHYGTSWRIMGLKGGYVLGNNN